MTNRLAIIGANEAITMLIQKAKDMGYETHVFAWACGDPGELVADYFYPISIDEKNVILDKCKDLGIVGICSITSDFAAPTVNYVARKLGLVCNPEETEVLARNKYKMRCALKQAGVYTPRFMLVDNNFSEGGLKNLSYPIIVKPTDRWSSKGVTKVNSKEGVFNAINQAVIESLEGNAIVEEFIEGEEYSAECICYKGLYKILAFTKKHTTGFPNYIEIGHEQPVEFAKETLNYISKELFKGLSALKITNGAAHIEFKITPDNKIGIIEIGARMGGDCIGTHLTPMSTGLDYIKMVIDVACGKKPSLEMIDIPKKVAIKFIINENDYNELLRIKEKQYPILEIGKIDLDFENNVIDSSTRHGYYIIEKVN